MRYVKTYFTKGPVVDRRNVRIPFALKDPPVTGTSFVFILTDGKRITLFHPATLLAYIIPDTAEELALAEDIPLDRKNMIDFINRKHKEYKSLEMVRNYKVAEIVISELHIELSQETILDDFEVPDREDGYLL